MEDHADNGRDGAEDLAFLRVIDEANTAMRNWPEWLQAAITPVRIRAPGVPDAVYLLDGELSLHPPAGVCWDD